MKGITKIEKPKRSECALKDISNIVHLFQHLNLSPNEAIVKTHKKKVHFDERDR